MYFAVLSGGCTRTGLVGAPTPASLPHFIFPGIIIAYLPTNCKKNVRGRAAFPPPALPPGRIAESTAFCTPAGLFRAQAPAGPAGHKREVEIVAISHKKVVCPPYIVMG